MHDCLRLVLLQRRRQPLGIQDVALDQRTPFHEVCPAARQVVVNHDLAPRPGEALAGMGAHKPRPTGDKDWAQGVLSLFSCDIAGVILSSMANQTAVVAGRLPV